MNFNKIMRYKTNLKGGTIETPQSKEESPKTSMNEGDRSQVLTPLAMQ